LDGHGGEGHRPSGQKHHFRILQWDGNYNIIPQIKLLLITIMAVRVFMFIKRYKKKKLTLLIIFYIVRRIDFAQQV
jgi:hypothetical protein